MVRPWPSTRNLPGIPETDDRSIVMLALLDDARAAAVGLVGWAVADDAAGAAVLLEPGPLEQAVAARAIPAATAAAAIRFLIGCSLVVTRVRKHHSRRPRMRLVPNRGLRALPRSGSAGNRREDTDQGRS